MSDSSVVVLANCTHLSIAETIRYNNIVEKVDSFELFSMPADQREVVADSLSHYDRILTIEHGKSFGPLATEALRERYSDKVHVLPTPFFSGLQPDMAYLQYKGQIAVAPNVLGDYHSALILHDCKSGYGKSEVIARYVNGEAFSRLDVPAVWEASLAELRRREENTQITISDFIENNARQKQLFLSFNHPTEDLIAHIVREFARTALGYKETVKSLPRNLHNLYADVFWPVQPAVMSDIGFEGASANYTYKQALRFGEHKFDVAEFAKRSYEFFCEENEVDEFSINTPSFLSDMLKVSVPEARSIEVAPTSGERKNIVLTHFGRSGSTVLAKLLEQHPALHWLHEVFSHYSIRDISSYDFTRDEMLEILQKESKPAPPRASFIGYEIKLMNFLQNPSCNMIDYAKEVTGPENVHVFLIRKNTLRRILSVVKASQTKTYHRTSSDDGYEAKRYAAPLSKPFDPDTGLRGDNFVDLIENVQKREKSILQNYNKVGIFPLLLTYEDDIEADPKIAYRKILDHLDLPYMPADIKLIKTGKKLADEVSNFEELAEQLNGSPYEWMLG